jgi:hypothetical protein
MKTVRKYELEITDTQKVKIPLVFPLCVQMQHGKLCLWAAIDTEKEEKEYAINIRGTGHPMEGVGEYIGTVQDDVFVWHVFIKDSKNDN